MNRIIVAIGLLVFVGMGVVAQDVQWRGPERNGIYPDTGLLKEWPAEGPELLLKVEGLGGGYSSAVLYKELIYLTGRRDSIEVISAVDLQGKVVWETSYGKAWMRSYQETRNTPTIENDRIYIEGTMGTVNCIDAASGKILWAVNTNDEFEGEMHTFGQAESLVITDDAVLSSPVGEKTVMVALDKNDGSFLWSTVPIGGTRSYASPLLIEHNEQKLVLVQSSIFLIGIDPANGEVFFTYDLVKYHSERGRRTNTNTPLFIDGEIFVTTGYNDQTVMLSLSDDCRSVSVKWTDDVMDNHHGGVVEIDGYIYGANWLSNGKGNWVCLEWETGELMYEITWNNKGSIISADGMLYLFDEKMGHVGLAKASPEDLTIVGTFQVTDGRGPRWAHPSIYDGMLLLRHNDVLLVYDVKVSRGGAKG